MKKVLGFVLLCITCCTSVSHAQEAAQAASSGNAADKKAALLDEELSFVRSAPAILKVPMSYRLVPICNKKTADTLKLITKLNDRTQTNSVALVKPEQLPPKLRAIPNCPQCVQEKKLTTFISLEVSDWLRRLPESRLEKIAEVCTEH